MKIQKLRVANTLNKKTKVFIVQEDIKTYHINYLMQRGRIIARENKPI